MRYSYWFAWMLTAMLAGCGSSPAPSSPKGPESPPSPKTMGNQSTDSKPADTTGHITVTTGTPVQSIEEYTAAIQRDPNEVNKRGELAYQLRGAAYMKQGDRDKAIADFTEAIRIYRERKPQYYQFRLMEVLDARAQSHRQKGETVEAIADHGDIIDFGTHFTSGDLTEVMGVQGFTCQALMNRAKCYDELKQPDKATADYKAATKMQPSLMTDELRKRLEPAAAGADDTHKGDAKSKK
jgi:tetratricopeptide (TPR) repeat protein